MHMISNSVKGDIKVALTGDGGDELFGGYSKYTSYKWKQLMLFLPNKLKYILISCLSDNKENVFLNFMRKFKRFLESYDIDTEKMQINYLDQLNNREYEGLFGSEKKSLPNSLFSGSQNFTELNKVLFRDFRFSLLGDMLVKLDRHSMANSIEVRVPFLDRRVIDFSSTISPELGLIHRKPKYLLKNILNNYVPEKFYLQHKQGFSFNLVDLLNNELKEDLQDTLMSKDLFGYEFIDSNRIHDMVSNYYSGKGNMNEWGMWTLYSLQKWANLVYNK